MIYLIFIISIFIHEFGHIFASKLFNVEFGKTKLNLLGFSNRTINLGGIPNWKKIAILISGSTFNFLCAIYLAIFGVEKSWILTNLFLGIFNLFPIIPLDGANILLCVFTSKEGNIEALKISLKISRIFLILLSFIYGIIIIVLKNIAILILLLYLWYLFIREERYYEIYLRAKKSLNKIF